MNLQVDQTQQNRGSSLIEAVIAMGVLAVAIPLVFGALAESAKSGMSSEAETRSTWIVPACMEEILASREGRPQFFTTTAVGQVFPPAGEIWALAFSPEGTPFSPPPDRKPLGKLTKTQYDKGIKEINSQPVRYIASISSAKPASTTDLTPLLQTRISLEYPASAPAARRQKLEFYTRIP
jgi:type II secretory pathway pseudopilin PulG